MTPRRAAIAALLCALWPAGRARAQALPGSIEIGGGGGRFYGGAFAKGSNEEFEHRVEADDDVLAGFWLGAQLTPRIGIEMSVRKSQEDIVNPAPGVFPREPTAATLELTTVETGILFSFPFGQFAPYLGLDGGISNININVPDRAVRDVNRFGISAAAGAKFYAARWVGFRVEGRARATYLGRRSNGQDRGWTDGGRWFRNSEIFGGVFFAFGGKS